MAAYQKKKILIVEDDKQISKILKDKISKTGYKVIMARNGQEGLEKALKEQPSLILLDILMPKLNGIEMLKKLRKDAWGKNATVVILSNISNNNTSAEAKGLGVDCYMIKADHPINDIVGKIRSILK